VTKTLRDIDLVDKANTFAKHLSAGEKRKLSVGIAVIGDPRVCSRVVLNYDVNFHSQVSLKK
jgi:ABC-type multidrug transport system ATPase subunit